jgi:Zn-finger nucleic acid-binding protein
MESHALDAHSGRTVTIDLCQPCQAIWFDQLESVALTPGGTLGLFRIIGERTGRAEVRDGDVTKCPRCQARLRRTSDRQRATRFEYFKCPNGHGRLITFFEFLKEKDFVRPLTGAQIAELRQNVQTVNCSNCGAPINLAQSTACSHCGSPLSMLDLPQAERLLQQLRAASGPSAAIDPMLPLELARARREVERAFAGIGGDDRWFAEAETNGLVAAGLKAVARWLKHER